jgi:CRISPR-associated protein Cmr2
METPTGARAEASAKAYGRNRFALRLLFSGGQYIEWVCPWVLLPRLLTGYRDREGLSGEQAQWGHLAADVVTLKGRRSLSGDRPEAQAVAEALWEIYFPGLDPPKEKAINQPLADWLAALAQVLARLQKPVRQEVTA